MSAGVEGSNEAPPPPLSVTGQPLSGWCPRCGSSSFLLPQFFARLSSVDHPSTFPLGSNGLQLWWWSWHPCAARAQSSNTASWWWWSPYPLAGTALRCHGWKWFLDKKMYWILPRLVVWKDDSLARSSSVIHQHPLIPTEGLTLRSSGRASAQSRCQCCTKAIYFAWAKWPGFLQGKTKRYNLNKL